MKIFIITTASHEVYGHGDTGTEYTMRRSGCYGTGEFPPAFTVEADAQKMAVGASNAAHSPNRAD